MIHWLKIVTDECIFLSNDWEHYIKGGEKKYMIAELNRSLELSGLGFEMETLYETKFADIKFFDEYSKFRIYGGEF